ncbi:MAG: helix-turn-helix domain-containing protein [Monoglobales bacterium]
MDNIRDLRKKAGLTQRELANWLEIPLRTLESWERGIRKCPEWANKLVQEKMLNELFELKAGDIRAEGEYLKNYLEREQRKELIIQLTKLSSEDFFNMVVKIYVDLSLHVPYIFWMMNIYNEADKHRFWQTFCKGLI